MAFTKLYAPSLKELFIKELEGMILSGQLEIGSKLPSERDLADSMQVSRAVVNAGLVEMSHKGFLEMRPRVGTFVADYRRNGTTETLISIMGYNGGRLGKNEIKSILEVRLVLERLAIEQAIPRITEEDVVRLTALYEAMINSPSPKEVGIRSFAFHQEFCMISGNVLLPLIFNSFTAPTQALWERFYSLHGMEPLARNARELLEFAIKRDVTGAIDSITKSINDTIYGNKLIFSE